MKIFRAIYKIGSDPDLKNYLFSGEDKNDVAEQIKKEIRKKFNQETVETIIFIDIRRQ